MADPPRIAVWHRNDLRVRDNPALRRAADDGRPAPVFVFDPVFYRSGMACDARLRFLHECVADLQESYADLGSDLALYHGDPGSILADLPVDRVYVTRSVTGRYGRRRDDRLFDRPSITPVADDGIDREGRPREAYDWQASAEAYFDADPLDAPASVPPIPLDSPASVGAVEAEYDVDPEKARVLRGGESAAHDRLRAFAGAIDRYPGGISPPAAAEERCSRLSPYLATGCLTPRQARGHVETAAGGTRGAETFERRLFWNRHYTQKLEDWPGWMETAVNPVFRGLFRGEHDPELTERWMRGETGFPLVDAGMRALAETGHMNFRLRATCATFYHYVLRNWWRAGADHYYRHLIDADAAINYTQWQSQCNLTGVHPVRIYNPAKGVRENDPEGEYVRRYVPELRAFPSEHLDRPEKAPLAAQEACGVRIGEDYPRPVVDFEARRAETRETYARLADRAEEAIEEDPEIGRRASLSQRGSRGPEDGDGGAPTPEEQASLEEF